MNEKLIEKLKNEIQLKGISGNNGIPVLLNQKYISGDNEKYMKMYDWMSRGYDIVEKFIGGLKYGKSIRVTREKLMSELEWKNSASVLYVSIGTGTDLKYIPDGIDLNSLNIIGVDISIGMLEKCRKNYKDLSGLSLVNACGEDLPFKDNTFDIVFHVGGINFFNDKGLALSEMLRVAKRGTKIMVADETSDYIEKEYKTSFFSKKYFKEQNFNLDALVSLVPYEAKDKKVEYLWEKRFYYLTFRKP